MLSGGVQVRGDALQQDAVACDDDGGGAPRMLIRSSRPEFHFWRSLATDE